MRRVGPSGRGIDIPARSRRRPRRRRPRRRRPRRRRPRRRPFGPGGRYVCPRVQLSEILAEN
ncbi:MAG: hypothetical protein FJ276_25585 [Planctomycetes bacterium]|nr:hypothetical protein [Planctomycetota bacterium]